MKTLKKYSLLIVAFLIISAEAQSQIVLATIKKKDAPKKETVTATAFTDSTKSKQTTNVAAAEEEPAPAATFTLSGSIDTYFHSSFGTQNYFPAEEDGFPPTVVPGGAYAPSTSFADLKGFSLGMANVIFAYQGEKSGFVADLVLGPRGQAAVFGTASGQAIINQMYAYRKFNDNFTLNLGQFNTFLGYEVISPAVNFHYSTSYLFSWGPFNHTGVRADFAFGDGFVAKAAIMNPTDIVEFNPVNTVTFGGQFGYSNDAGGIWLNVLAGDQDGTLDKDVDGIGSSSAGSLFQWDITTSWNLGDKFSLGFNTSMQSVGTGEVIDDDGNVVDVVGDASSFLGFAVYPKITISESFALGVRAEYFAITNGHLSNEYGYSIFGLDAGGEGSVIAATLSANYKVGGLTFIPEIRIDKTAENSFYKAGDDLTNGATKDLMATLNLAAVYKF